METSRRADANEAATIKEGRDFFNEKSPEDYYKLYVYVRILCNEGRDVPNPRDPHFSHGASIADGIVLPPRELGSCRSNGANGSQHP